MCEIINPDNLPDEYIASEIIQAEQEHGRKIHRIEFHALPDGENCRQVITWEPVGFEKIRRITGYLVGTLDRFNNGKRAEVMDRVKHGVCSCDEV